MATPLEMTLVYASGAVVPYLIGSVPFGFLIGKMKGLDIRTQGSGNIGATNVTRVIGKNWGKLCFLLDLMKGILPVVLVSLLVRRGTFDDPCGILPAIAALATVCGHIYPVYLHFKGGKGISTAAGAILALNPPALLSAGVLWVIVFLTSRYVSLASIAAAVSLPVFAWIMKTAGVWTYSPTEMILFCVLAVLAVSGTVPISGVCSTGRKAGSQGKMKLGKRKKNESAYFKNSGSRRRRMGNFSCPGPALEQT